MIEEFREERDCGTHHDKVREHTPLNPTTALHNQGYHYTHSFGWGSSSPEKFNTLLKATASAWQHQNLNQTVAFGGHIEHFLEETVIWALEENSPQGQWCRQEPARSLLPRENKECGQWLSFFTSLISVIPIHFLGLLPRRTNEAHTLCSRNQGNSVQALVMAH